MPLDPAFESSLRERSAQSAFTQWMGYELVSVDEGACAIRLPLKDHHFNLGGIAHGGVIASILDSCIGLALRTKIGGSSHVTVQLDIHYLAAARGGSITAEGTAVHTGKKMAYGEARVYDDEGRLLATGAATFVLLEARPQGPPQGDA